MSTVKTILNRLVVYATDRSKAVSRCFSYSVWLCGLYYSAFHVLKSSRALCPLCFVIPFSIVITSLGEEGVGLCASRAFICLLCTC